MTRSRQFGGFVLVVGAVLVMIGLGAIAADALRNARGLAEVVQSALEA